MVQAMQSLPMRFPCWVKATYSWGGETKRDLGFMEGDLIECLNAGDGSWWMGRLRRDRRMVGLFPSNFVEVLPDDFQPQSLGSRNPSPLPTRQDSGDQKANSKIKTGFRKPFQAYSKATSPNPDGEGRSGSGSKTATPTGSMRNKRPFSSMKRPSIETRNNSPLSANLSKTGSDASARAPAPRAHRSSNSRAESPAPPFHHSKSRATSPVLSSLNRAISPAPPSNYRAASPAPAVQRYAHSPAPSPIPFEQHYARGPFSNPAWEDAGSPPPPAPPPHRYATSRAPSPNPSSQLPDAVGGYHTPIPRSPAIGGHTPSPLTNAMNEVMNCFEDMGIAREATPEPVREPPGIWSPEAFGEIYFDQRRPLRPQSAFQLGGQQDSGYVSPDFEDHASGQPQLDDYVQRMESRLRQLHEQEGTRPGSEDVREPPTPPPKTVGHGSRPQSSLSMRCKKDSKRGLRQMKSTLELGKEALSRSFTLKSNATTSSNSTEMTTHTLMSGTSAGGFSATSAGSFYRKKFTGEQQRPMSSMQIRGNGNQSNFGNYRPETPSTGVTGISYHSSHGSGPQTPGTVHASDWTRESAASPGVLGGLATPRAKKSGFFKKMMDSAKTGAATARSTISSSGLSSRPGSAFGGSRPASPEKRSLLPNGITSIAGGTAAPTRPQSSMTAREMGLGGAIDWVQVRRDVNRSNSLSKNERIERADRCEMLDIPVIAPITILYETAEGDEGHDGYPVSAPTDFNACALALVDKTARFVNNLPPTTNAASLVQGFLCRPYRSDVQRLRAIFTWAAERIAWEEDFETEDRVDTRRLIQNKRGCSQEIAFLVTEMCAAVGIHAEVVRGYLKTPGETLDFDMASRPNHWWNAVVVDGEWRIMDCSLANSTNTRRKLYSVASASAADGWWFLTRPMEICFTHVPLLSEQQHIVPPIAPEVLLALPCACPPYFKHGLRLIDYDTSDLHLENLELSHIHLAVPEDVECVAEMEVRAFAQDVDGDFFESGDVIQKPMLVQAEWLVGGKQFTIKSLLPGDERQGVLKIYAGKRGLMHSIKSNPHALALALPITHTGANPPYTFLTRHPTPHAQRHDLYVVQPQCSRLAVNNTFVFSFRQHPSSLSSQSPNLSSAGSSSSNGFTFSSTSGGRCSPNPYARPASAMSMASVSGSGSNYSDPSNSSNQSNSTNSLSASDLSRQKPAKLAVQSPSGKIIRLTRKTGELSSNSKEPRDGTEWETVIKVGESGTWRGLVLADRSARWCVFAEWECV